MDWSHTTSFWANFLCDLTGALLLFMASLLMVLTLTLYIITRSSPRRGLRLVQDPPPLYAPMDYWEPAAAPLDWTPWTPARKRAFEAEVGRLVDRGGRWFEGPEDFELLGMCLSCIHKYGGQPGCAAFPDGIPEPILAGEHDHRRPFPGDHGIHFIASPGVNADPTWNRLRRRLAGKEKAP